MAPKLFSRLFSNDTSSDLNGMPDSATIEGRVVLVETAREKLAELAPDSRQAGEIRAAMSRLEDADWSADHHDECSHRPLIRGRKI